MASYYCSNRGLIQVSCCIRQNVKLYILLPRPKIPFENWVIWMVGLIVHMASNYRTDLKYLEGLSNFISPWVASNNARRLSITFLLYLVTNNSLPFVLAKWLWRRYFNYFYFCIYKRRYHHLLFRIGLRIKWTYLKFGNLLVCSSWFKKYSH